MPRPRKIDRPHRLQVNIPESIASKVQLELYSEIEGRVPVGATSDLVTGLLIDWLKRRGVFV